MTLACLNACQNNCNARLTDSANTKKPSCLHASRQLKKTCTTQLTKWKNLQQKSHFCICHRSVILDTCRAINFISQTNFNKSFPQKLLKLYLPNFCTTRTNAGFTSIVDFYQNLQIWILSALTQCQ